MSGGIGWGGSPGAAARAPGGRDSDRHQHAEYEWRRAVEEAGGGCAFAFGADLSDLDRRHQGENPQNDFARRPGLHDQTVFPGSVARRVGACIGRSKCLRISNRNVWKAREASRTLKRCWAVSAPQYWKPCSSRRLWKARASTAGWKRPFRRG